MIFKIYECTFGFKFNGVNYEFLHVESMQIEDPENTKLIRGANASNKTGLVYKEGIKDAKKITVTLKGMTAAIKAILDGIYDNKDRVEVYCISKDGSSKIGREAILSQTPKQLQVDENADSMNVALLFETFDLTEVHKE